MGGASLYATTRDALELPRIAYSAWLEGKK